MVKDLALDLEKPKSEPPFAMEAHQATLGQSLSQPLGGGCCEYKMEEGRTALHIPSLPTGDKGKK